MLHLKNISIVGPKLFSHRIKILIPSQMWVDFFQTCYLNISKNISKNIVFCYQNCSDLLWDKIVLVIEKNVWNSRLKADKLQFFWDYKSPFILRSQLRISSFFQNSDTFCFDLYWHYHNFERNEIRATGFLKWTDFRTIYSNSERSEQFLLTECFFHLFLEVSQI